MERMLELQSKDYEEGLTAEELRELKQIYAAHPVGRQLIRTEIELEEWSGSEEGPYNWSVMG